MSGYSTIDVVRDGPVDWITLNRPERLNALTGTMVRELWDYFTRLHQDYSCRIVVLRGAGKGFCAGLDLTAFRNKEDALPTGATAEGPGPSLSDVVVKMRTCPQPIVSLIHGAACGGGFAFALASDIRIAGRSARMQVTFVKLGLSGCELGMSYFLPRLVGMSVASELMMTGRFIGAERALAAGLVSEVADDEGLEEAGRRMVVDLLAASPVGLRKTKETLGKAISLHDLTSVIRLEEHTQMECMRDPAFQAAIEGFATRKATA